MTLLGLLPLSSLLLFFLVAFGGRSSWPRRRYGGSGIAWETGRGLFSAGAVLLPIGFDGEAALALVRPQFAPRGWGSALAGALLIATSMVFVVAAQLQMGASWRIGIDRDARPGLITNGLYRLCRNHIYAGLLLTWWGLLLLMPHWLTALLGIIGCLGISVQVRGEERYLLAAYGDEFAAYCRRVGRFWPRLRATEL